MLTHDILKIKYVRLGYLTKNYPYHLISDKEMFDAFICLYETSEYDPTKTYNVGDYVTYDGSTYVCIHAIETPKAFSSSDWEYQEYFFDSCYPNPFAEKDYIYEKTRENPETHEIEVVSRTSLSEVYTQLRQYIIDSIKAYLEYYGTTEEETHQIPNWIYTYMLGEVVYQQSEYLDIQDTLTLLKCSNLDNEFTREACINCYITSIGYISTLSANARPATIFGEPHVIKQLRMAT